MAEGHPAILFASSFWYRQRDKLARLVQLDLTHAQERYAQLLESTVERGCRWLDLGCGKQILPEWALPTGRGRRRRALRRGQARRHAPGANPKRPHPDG
jgi:hypothetical protein